MNTILFTGGGTAGHVMPNVALKNKLSKNFDRFVYVGSQSGIENQIAKENGMEFFPITTTKLIRKFDFKNFLIPFKLLKAISEAKCILKNIKPSVVFSKGGYVALPVVIACKKLKIPVYAHESDLSMGLANKLCVNYSKKVFTSFSQTAKELENGIYSGSPLRDEILLAQKSDKYTFNNSKLTLLIIGGSLGSQTINNIIYSNIDNLLKTYNVIHVCGKGNLQKIQRKNYIVIEYTNEMPQILASVDIAITRGGSNVLFELMAKQIPSLIIPLSKAVSRGDQIENAKYFTDKNLAYALEEENLNWNNLFDKLQDLQKNYMTIKNNIKLSNIPNGTEIISSYLKLYGKY